ncbi:MAG: dihydrofolate reductase family protein [Actinomycetota bacterium]
MRKLIAVEWSALDGVMQGPGDPDEDTDGGFEHGGWHMPYFDDISRAWVVEGYAAAGGFVFGRRTYDLLASYWPNASEEEQVIAVPLNTKPKYVVSTTLTAPLEWEHSTLLEGDLGDAVTGLKQEDGDDLHVVGSSRLVHALLEHDLIDGFRLMIDPLVLGGGKRLFGDDGPRLPLRLTDSRETTTGAIIASYERADA